MTRDVVICNPLRTPVGRYGGVFTGLSATELAAHTLRELVGRTDLPADAVDDVLFGQCYPSGESPAIGRVAALDAGFPVSVPGLQSTAAAAPASRRSSTPPCRWRRGPGTC
jgi:acetyl-CoA C-acetyltransferase